MTQRDADIGLLERILDPCHEPELDHDARQAFLRMLDELQSEERHMLSRKQRKWAEETWDAIKPIFAHQVPRGREVPTPAVLQNPQEALKRKPPMRPR